MLVRAKTAFYSTATQPPVLITPADVLRDDNPHVKAHRDNFEELRDATTADNGIEQATARPGDKRNR